MCDQWPVHFCRILYLVTKRVQDASGQISSVYGLHCWLHGSAAWPVNGCNLSISGQYLPYFTFIQSIQFLLTQGLQCAITKLPRCLLAHDVPAAWTLWAVCHDSGGQWKLEDPAFEARERDWEREPYISKCKCMFTLRSLRSYTYKLLHIHILLLPKAFSLPDAEPKFVWTPTVWWQVQFLNLCLGCSEHPWAKIFGRIPPIASSEPSSARVWGLRIKKTSGKGGKGWCWWYC